MGISSEVQMFHPQPTRNRWDREELADAVQSSSPHVQYLLHELSRAPRVGASQLKSKRVAYAIVQRICNSAGKDSLVLVEDEDGEKQYFLNPRYRDDIRPLVADAKEPPPSAPKPPRRKSGGLGRMRRGMSAMDGIADPRGTFGSPRRVAQASGGRSIVFPEEVPLAFCQELMGFLNSTGMTRYRIVLDSEGPRLEVASP